MSLAASRINHRRAAVCSVIRAAAVCALAVGAFFVVKRLVFGVLTGSIRDAWAVFMGTGESHEFSMRLALLGAGAVAAAASGRLARWIVVLPSEACPACGYGGITSRMDRCPECGLEGFATTDRNEEKS